MRRKALPRFALIALACAMLASLTWILQRHGQQSESFPNYSSFRTLPEGATATDLVLTVTQMLRQKKVVGKFVEFHGPGIAALTLPDRATVANMDPESGAAIGVLHVMDGALANTKHTEPPREPTTTAAA